MIEDEILDSTLRPAVFHDFVGQKGVKENLKIAIEAAHGRKESLDHILFHGPPGLGKTTLAYIVAAEAGHNIKISSGPAIERQGDLAAILTDLGEGDILFIDEIHRLHRSIEEMLYPAMEEYNLDIVVGKGPSAKTVRIELPKFTLVGATTRAALLSSPMRDRFGMVYRLDYYEQKDIEKILSRSARILDIKADEGGIKEIAKRSRRTPRVANRLLKRVRDYAQVKGGGEINAVSAVSALESLEIDAYGLDPLDLKILSAIVEKYQGGPVGLKAISAVVHEEPDTLEDIYEPYLLELGMIERTARGRKATQAAYKHLGVDQWGF